MASFSTLRYVINWLLVHNNWKDLKYQKLLHPLLSATLSAFTFINCVDKVGQIQSNTQELNISQKSRSLTAAFLGLYVITMFLTRFSQSGYSVFYEMIWACNMSLISATYGLIKNRTWIISAAMITVSTDQILWYVDLLGYLFLKKFPVGVAKYMIWPETTALRKLTSFHHIFFIPLCFFVLRKQNSFQISDWFSSCFMTLSLSILARLFVPHSIHKINEIVYMNVNLCRELWKDVNIGFLSQFNGANWYVAIPLSNSVWNFGNLLGFFILNFVFVGIKMIRY